MTAREAPPATATEPGAASAPPSGVKEPRTPERRCIATGASGDKSEMIRFVVGPDGTVVPDLAGKLPGRGMWTAADRKAVTKAVQKGLFAKAAGGAASAGPSLPDQVEILLFRNLAGLIGLARKAGDVTTGFDNVEDAITGRHPERLAALIEASDGSADGRDKLLGRARARDIPVPVLGCFTAEELGLALGRDHVVHAALFRSGIGDRIVLEARRLAGFRSIAPAAWGLSLSGGLLRIAAS